MKANSNFAETREVPRLFARKRSFVVCDESQAAINGKLYATINFDD